MVLRTSYLRCSNGKNGFYAFGSSLHVFPITSNPENGLEGWNSGSLWRNGYQILLKGCSSSPRTFCRTSLSFHKGEWCLRFHAETGRTDLMSDSIEKWADVILSNYQTETGWTFTHDWQLKNGPLPKGKRLMPKTPFFLGGEYKMRIFGRGAL